jgi:protocatechuate 3,4-dioxygenase beta subunit
MERKDFLKAAGALGLSSVFPFNSAKAEESEMALLEKELISSGACVATPSEMEGPYPLDLSSKPQFFRQDITEGKPGVPLKVTFKVVNFNNKCLPVANIRVDAWQCDAEGLYSGHPNQTGHNKPPQDLRGKTYLRGIQLTDSNGEVTFNTIYPGWYPGRAVHIHMNFFVNSKKGFTTQAAFPDALTKEVFTKNAVYGGQADRVNATDMGIFSDGVQYQTFTITPNSATGGYDAFLLLALRLDAVLDVTDHEPETYRQLVLKQNYPNPFNLATTIPFKLVNASNVVIDIYDMTGKKIAGVLNQRMDAGDHEVTLTRESVSLSKGNYMYQLTIENHFGRYHQCKVLTITD